MLVNIFNDKKFFNTLIDKEKKSAPQNLFTKGVLSLIYSGLKVSVVGSKKPTQQGIEDAQCLTGILTAQGATVVSGLAEGIDTVATKQLSSQEAGQLLY